MPIDEVTRAELETQRDDVSIALSAKMRTLALGILAFVWAVLSTNNTTVKTISTLHLRWLFATGFLAVLCLGIDLFHSMMSHWEIARLRSKMIKTKALTGQFEQDSLPALLADAAYWIKILVCIAACCSLLTLIYRSLFH